MKTPTLIPFATIFSSLLTNAFYIDRSDTSLNVVHFPIEKRYVSRDAIDQRDTSAISRRSLLTRLKNGASYYTTEISIGTPPQTIVLDVDTGSADTWVNDKASTYCSSNPGDCSKYGSYDPAASSTYAQVPNINFQITYSDGDGASGDFVKDTLVVGGKSVKGFQFGHAYSSNSNLGTIGLGYSAFAFGTDGGTPAYPTLPEALKINKLINLNAYSVWLNSIEAQAGSVLYGGVDTAKYSGPLTVLPIQKTDLSSKGMRSYEELIVNLNFASYGDIKSSAAQVLFDTGTEYSQLPEDFVSSVYTAMGAVPDSAYKYYYADCSMANSKKTMDFQFGTKPKLITIRVPLSSFVYTPYQNNAVPNNANNEPLCGLALIKVPNSGDPAILGDSFMRAAYTVFDLTNNQISIAQAKYTSASKVVEIPAGGVSRLKI